MGKKWSSEEFDFLKNNYKILTSKKIAEKLNRTEISIRIKLQELKLLKRSKIPENITEEIIKDYNNDLSIERIVKKYNYSKFKLKDIIKGIIKKRKIDGNKHKNWKGYGELSYVYYSSLLNGAKSRNLDFTVSIEYLWNLFLLQNRTCALSGLDILFPTCHKNKINQTASLDRIDSSKGYIEGNVQWVHKSINQMKWDMNQSDFLFFCQTITKYYETKNRF